MRFVDLSHVIEHGMTTYPGLPGPVICDFLSREASRARYAPGVEFQIGKIEMAPGFALVEIPESSVDTVIEALADAKIRGQRVTARRERSR